MLTFICLSLYFPIIITQKVLDFLTNEHKQDLLNIQSPFNLLRDMWSHLSVYKQHYACMKCESECIGLCVWFVFMHRWVFASLIGFNLWFGLYVLNVELVWDYLFRTGAHLRFTLNLSKCKIKNHHVMHDKLFDQNISRIQLFFVCN